MKSLFVLTSLLLLASLSDALICTCSDCGVGDECSGDNCYFRVSKASTEPDAEIEHVRGCVSSGSNSQCNTSSTLNTMLCCNHSDYCNENLTAELGQTQGTPSLPTSQPDSEFTIAPILIPGIPDTTTASDSSSPSSAPNLITSFPSITPNPSCFRSNSALSDVIEVCSLTSTCYSSLRRMMNGDIVSRRGCSVGLCVEETRNRKVKRCCDSHMCNIELSIDEFFPDQVTADQVNTTLTPDSTTTTEAVSDRPHISPPILTPISSTTEAVDMVTSESDNLIYCHCDGSDCVDDILCKSSHACATEFTVDDGIILYEKRLCVDNQSKCGITEPNKYTSCCTSRFCNMNPRYEEIPSELFARSHPPTITDELTTPPLTTPMTHPAAAADDLLFLVLTVVLSILAMLLLTFVVAALVTCYVRHRRRRKTLQLSKKHVIASVNNFSTGCHGNVYDDTSRAASVQSSDMSTTSNQTTPSKEHLMTCV